MMSVSSIKKTIFVCSFLFLTLMLLPLKTTAQNDARKQAARSEKLIGLRDLFNGDGFVRIPAGEFRMGSNEGAEDERPIHRVRISHGFEMGKFEVTQAQWEAVMESKENGHDKSEPEKAAQGEPTKNSNPSTFKGADLPVENVSWEEVQQFLRTLNAMDKEHLYRLPTEAEWEYASRAGSAKGYTGDLNDVAWTKANSNGHTQPVGQKKPNAWGLYDMFGNVMEWVQDWYDYYGSNVNNTIIDPQGAAPGSYRVYRGCSWYSTPEECYPAARSFDMPAHHYYSLGLRLVRTAK